MADKYELKENSVERTENASKVMSLLKYMHKSEMQSLERDYGDYEDLEYPFLEGDDPIIDKRKRKMSKIETDNLLMDSFSQEYKRIEEEVRKEMNLENSYICTENLSSLNLQDMTNEFVEDPSFLQEIKQLLSLSGLDALFAERNKEAMERKKGGKIIQRDSKLFKPLPIQNVPDVNSLSGLWRLLDGGDVENGFPITDIAYNALKDERLDWLCREDLTFDQREENRKKIEQWMQRK